jgi:hypothetical protein
MRRAINLEYRKVQKFQLSWEPMTDKRVESVDIRGEFNEDEMSDWVCTVKRRNGDIMGEPILTFNQYFPASQIPFDHFLLALRAAMTILWESEEDRGV